ncbi:DUF1152 domain-containing protein [Aeropyrum camini]|uniref:Uncharacterized protein conserved in archaea n=1 Tax=Aeropyrum camini SY1 = JCM 12091 TaxID=1198449 RepID=U3T9C6_9CREN|nr:DUF1152 domain-containing protein [Aeropyrum camini]BAN90107.1 uncharacterized protein conserved in archaea [Aeropyrum camini SY1 = JCM 12091]
MKRIGDLEDLADAKVLVFGAGGGGDALGAIHLYRRLERIGARPILGSIVWERRVVDPTPGPIPVESIIGSQKIAEHAAIVRGWEYVERGGVRFIPQIVRASRVLGVEAVALGVDGGALGLANALETLEDFYGLDAIIALDSGGDALALGCEEDLWSPLADAVSLSSLKEVNIGVKLLAVHGYGVDGELPRSYVLKRIADVAREGGLVGFTSITRLDAGALDRIERYFVSEASKAPVWAFKGEWGGRSIRGGSRVIELDPLQATTAIMDIDKVVSLTPLPHAVANSRSIYEANSILNDRCVYTELNLEEDLASNPGLRAAEARSRGRRLLRRLGCRPLC